MLMRNLRAEEIEVRVQQCKKNGCILLLYKDARCDMAILDESVGPLYWKREHLRDNKNCVVSVYDKEFKQWVSKEDTGTESNTEQAKGLASDSFKRACFNWGIGRELYSSPFTWVNLDGQEIKDTGRKDKYNNPVLTLAYGLNFHVSKIEIDDSKVITFLEIKDNKNKTRFSWGADNKVVGIPKEKISLDTPKESIADQVRNYLRSGNIPVEDLARYKDDLNNKAIQPDRKLLDKLIATYGPVR